MSKLARLEVVLLALLACGISFFAANQSGVRVWYVAAFAFGLICIGATRLPALAQLADKSSVHIRVWWAPAVLSLGMLLLVGVLVARFIIGAAI
ncbi:MAG TPA: hypothetical protein VF339_05505 [Gammaproteobacteria bacterium]